jgi:hypothetical protein
VIYELRCDGATAAIVPTGDPLADCATAGGSSLWLEATSVLPELTLADGAQIAGAILALWAFAFCLRAIRNMIEEH